jgi:hypothetical protein
MPKYDFDPEFIRDIVLGDLQATDCPSVTITVHHEPLPLNDEVVLGLSVKSSSGTVTGKEVLSLKRVAREDAERTVWSAYHSIARKLSFKLFEQDPRIGLPLNDGFPNCPLFDPPYLIHPIRNHLREKGGDANWKQKPEVQEVKKTLTTCPFCEMPIWPYGGSRRPGVWCGGNVGFAHEECASWVKPRH